MKKIIFTLFFGIFSFAQNSSSECVNLRFEAQDFICTLEAKLSEDSTGALVSQEALKRKILCQESFLKICNNEIANGISDDSCESIKFEGQELICNLEATESAEAAGGTNFKNALKKKVDCQNTFLKTCHRELGH